MVLQLTFRAKLGPKSQVVVPKPIRQLLNIGPGDELSWRVDGEHVVVERRSAGDIVEEFINAVPNKRPEPKHIDWKKEFEGYYG